MLTRPGTLRWLGIGLIIRLLIAPFTISADLLAVYWRSHLIAYDGEVFSEYLVNMGAHYTHALSLRLLDPVLPSADVLWTDPWWWSDSAGLAPQIQRAFVDTDGIFGTLLALKTPYLLFDLAAGVVILLMVARVPARQAQRAWAFWMLSPIGLYASYAFGRYEMFAVALVVVAIWACESDHPWWAAVALGVAITMRGYPVMLIPIFALVAMRGVTRQAAWTALSLLPLGLVLWTNTLWADTLGEFSRLRDFNTGATFFAYTLPVDGPGPIYLFGLFAVGLYVVLLGRSYDWWGERPPEVSELWVWLAVFHAGLFALTTFSAHYFAWFTPFVALALARRPTWRGNLGTHLLMVVVVFGLADLLGGPGTTWGLFQPLAPDLADAVPNLREVTLTSPDLATQLAGGFRSAFIAVMVIWAWPAVRELARSSGPSSGPSPTRP
ncbi:glycosyltransferase 87 family protein [Euzebya tangerina]|uniref:glycosyltransferase 87 family protein n=1 Tax=Euzebya tangerina TaxID=591198 RepID=UPI0013C33E0C|nr:glycosyltransferase 87 family protein [Euzebya tangerina]